MTKVEITLKGRPGHGSIPTAADNALVRAADVVARVHAYQAPTVITPGELLVQSVHAFPFYSSCLSFSISCCSHVVRSLRQVFYPFQDLELS